MVAADHVGETDRPPSLEAPRRSISNISQTTPQPSRSVTQAGWGSYRDDGKAQCCGRLRPIPHARPPSAYHGATTPETCGRSTGVRPPIALMALLASVHTLETVSQIVIANFAENGNDLLLNAKIQFHFALCCHARIYAARSSDPGFSGKCGWSSWRWGCCAGLEHPRGLLQRFVSRVSTTFDN